MQNIQKKQSLWKSSSPKRKHKILLKITYMVVQSLEDLQDGCAMISLTNRSL